MSRERSPWRSWRIVLGAMVLFAVLPARGIAQAEDAIARAQAALEEGRTEEANGVGHRPRRNACTPMGAPAWACKLTNERLQLLACKLEGGGRVLFTDLESDGRPTGTRVELMVW